jgi:uracil-DNA glycosylase
MTRPEPPAPWAHLAFFAERWPALWGRLADAPAWQPAPDRIFRALALTPPEATRVVILGQDPYHTPGRATGLAFGFPPGTPPRDSLRNILAEVAADTGQPAPAADLTGWARQGVLLLNTALTVPVGQANGHKTLGWGPLVTEILHHLAGTGPRAFLLWGGPAQRLCRDLPRDGHLFLESAHPSPLSAYRGFLGSRPFSATNRWLAAKGLPPIDWSS